MPSTTPATMFFVRKTRPQARQDAHGVFTLALHVKTYVSARQAQAYTAVWRGDAARQFWALHSEALTPGQPLALELQGLQSRHLGTGYHVQTWIEADVLACALLPRAHEVHTSAIRTTTPEHVTHA